MQHLPSRRRCTGPLLYSQPCPDAHVICRTAARLASVATEELGVYWLQRTRRWRFWLMPRLVGQRRGELEHRFEGGRMRRLLEFLFTIVWMAAAGWAQAPTGAITGAVVDPTGAVVAGVTVTVTNPSTNT